MQLASRELPPPPGLKNHLVDQQLNIGVVAALLFTMVELTPEDVGEQLVTLTGGRISFETCSHIFTFSAACAMGCLACTAS